ncbi:hypothetical protein GF354_04050 [Candidatus Peregrinibacteria bacterium]|nr:hypothetical protein [Candidatus Peregrinibacteria bacterium]
MFLKKIFAIGLATLTLFSGCSLKGSDNESVMNEITNVEGRELTKDGFSAILPSGWVQLPVSDPSIFLSFENDSRTMYLQINRFPHDENLVSPLITLNNILEESENLGPQTNLQVVKEPEELLIDGNEAAHAVTIADLQDSNGQALSITQHSVILFSVPYDYQFRFEAKSEYFEEENRFFEEFLKTVKLN